METDPTREKFDTGVRKIHSEIKSTLVSHGLFGMVTHGGPCELPDGARIEIQARDKSVGRSFNREQIEGCHLRVGPAVLADINAMIDELRPHVGYRTDTSVPD
jgi:hypothetical protein